MSEVIGSIHVEADLSRVGRREAAAIQSLEGKLCGANFQGALGPTALAAAKENEGKSSVPFDKIPLVVPKPVVHDLESGKASKDFGAVKMDVDLNQVTLKEAGAVEAAEKKMEGNNPMLQIDGLAAAAKTMAGFNKSGINKSTGQKNQPLEASESNGTDVSKRQVENPKKVIQPD